MYGFRIARSSTVLRGLRNILRAVFCRSTLRLLSLYHCGSSAGDSFRGYWNIGRALCGLICNEKVMCLCSQTVTPQTPSKTKNNPDLGGWQPANRRFVDRWLAGGLTCRALALASTNLTPASSSFSFQEGVMYSPLRETDCPTAKS